LTVAVQEGRKDSIEYSAVMYLEMYSQIVAQLSVGNEHDKSFKMNLTENFELQRRSKYKTKHAPPSPPKNRPLFGLLYQPQIVDDDKYGKVGGIVVRGT
jgi:hypothetical protein